MRKRQLSLAASPASAGLTPSPVILTSSKRQTHRKMRTQSYGPTAVRRGSRSAARPPKGLATKGSVPTCQALSGDDGNDSQNGTSSKGQAHAHFLSRSGQIPEERGRPDGSGIRRDVGAYHHGLHRSD